MLSEFGKVLRRRGVLGDSRALLGTSPELKEKTGFAAFDSTAPADMGGVAVIALGKTTAVTAGDAGCALWGVSRYGPRYGVCSWLGFACVWRRRDGFVLMAVTGSGVERSMAVT